MEIKNLLVITTHLKRQGPNVQLYYLAKSLKKLNYNVFVVVIDKDCKNDMSAELINLGVHVFKLNLSKFYSLFYVKNKISKIIIDNKIDLTYSYGLRADYYNSKQKNILRAISVRNLLKINTICIHGFVKGNIIFQIQKYLLNKVNIVLSCSSSVKDHLSVLGINSRVVRNVIDNSNRKRKILINDQKNVFTSVSSRLRGKNVEFLLESFVSNEYLKKCILQVVGYVDKKIKNKYSNYSNILFLGQINTIDDILLKSDFFISASLHEGLPNAVLEAMNLGTPVILSDIPSHKEIINSSKLEFGVIFENNNRESLLNSIINIRDKNYFEISSNAIKVIDENFNVEDVGENFISAIENYLNYIMSIEQV